VTTDDLLAEQIAYYRARAPWYDDWWYRRGQYAGDEEVGARWQRDLDAMLADLDDWLGACRPASVLELAAGTGELTRRIVGQVRHMTALDAAPETLARNAEKLGASAEKVRFVECDLFAWSPPEQYDAIVFGFWISHVPADRWDRFWTIVRDALTPDGHVWFCDSARPELAWEAGVLPRPDDPVVLRGDGTIDRSTDVHVRTLPDQRTFRSVKRFYDAVELQQDLERRGFAASVRTTTWAFIVGRAARA
jgi:demethylmenaquinone methyltransferase/2-methoxy-6-polyprenyl-1,4-benzoquinol methylase